MNKTIALSMAVLAGLTACSSNVPVEPVSPVEVLNNIHAWNGRDVTVEGWLGVCKGYDCRIFPTLADAIAVKSSEPSSKEWMAAFDRGLGIGSALNFDELAAPLQFHKVQISGRISDVCRGLHSGCLDRAPDIQPSAIGLADLYKKEK